MRVCSRGNKRVSMPTPVEEDNPNLPRSHAPTLPTARIPAQRRFRRHPPRRRRLALAVPRIDRAAPLAWRSLDDNDDDDDDDDNDNDNDDNEHYDT
ncbi:hypothetical protein ST47_g1563 [Ascochyta rabiei]|uniref:Uncharacterized protein n=1 Tax=Didymella rabiei TaxID=5454 RepID=A0A163KVV8_DIDRA|nr:hypothetical protein ST47_g1563 [Ascochyta rabiei]